MIASHDGRPPRKPLSPRAKALSSRQVKAMRRSLLRWFRKNARPLPWRESNDFYHVWLSEIMLQQTQVETVIPYFRRFIRAFPNLQALAEAPLEQVLEHWSGLGYYRRARHLHQAAQIIVAEWGGQFPRDWKSVRALPGVGDYTARAILSIADNQPYAVLEGNVARVMARLLALRGNIRRAHFRQTVERQAQALLSRWHPGEFNQAVMEIGQTLCRLREPRCPQCPLRRWCRARRLGQAEAFPEPSPRRPTVRRHLALAIIPQDGRLLVVKGLDEGLTPDLWNFPSAFGSSPQQALRALRRKIGSVTNARLPLSQPVAEFRHNITYRSIRARVYLAKAEVRSPARRASQHDAAADTRWLTLDQLRRAALAQVARKAIQCLRDSPATNLA